MTIEEAKRYYKEEINKKLIILDKDITYYTNNNIDDLELYELKSIYDKLNKAIKLKEPKKRKHNISFLKRKHNMKKLLNQAIKDQKKSDELAFEQRVSEVSKRLNKEKCTQIIMEAANKKYYGHEFKWEDVFTEPEDIKALNKFYHDVKNGFYKHNLSGYNRLNHGEKNNELTKAMKRVVEVYFEEELRLELGLFYYDGFLVSWNVKKDINFRKEVL